MCEARAARSMAAGTMPPSAIHLSINSDWNAGPTNDPILGLYAALSSRPRGGKRGCKLGCDSQVPCLVVAACCAGWMPFGFEDSGGERRILDFKSLQIARESGGYQHRQRRGDAGS